MAIKSSTFGRVELSGEDAVRFRKMMENVRPSKKVKEAADRGRETLARMKRMAAKG